MRQPTAAWPVVCRPARHRAQAITRPASIATTAAVTATRAGGGEDGADHDTGSSTWLTTWPTGDRRAAARRAASGSTVAMGGRVGAGVAGRCVRYRRVR